MNFIGFDSDWKADALWGLIPGVAMILLNWLIPQFTIGFPLLPQATTGERIFIVVVLAVIAEEFFFRGLIFSVLKDLITTLGAVIATSLLFALFHIYAYASSLSLQGIVAVSGALIAAGIFGLIASFISIQRNSLISSMILHLIFNAWLMSKTFVVVSI